MTRQDNAQLARINQVTQPPTIRITILAARAITKRQVFHVPVGIHHAKTPGNVDGIYEPYGNCSSNTFWFWPNSALIELTVNVTLCTSSGPIWRSTVFGRDAAISSAVIVGFSCARRISSIKSRLTLLNIKLAFDNSSPVSF